MAPTKKAENNQSLLIRKLFQTRDNDNYVQRLVVDRCWRELRLTFPAFPPAQSYLWLFWILEFQNEWWMQTNTNYYKKDYVRHIFANITIIENRGQNFERLNATVGWF